jgi:hypothetical protein
VHQDSRAIWATCSSCTLLILHHSSSIHLSRAVGYTLVTPSCSRLRYCVRIWPLKVLLQQQHPDLQHPRPGQLSRSHIPNALQKLPRMAIDISLFGISGKSLPPHANPDASVRYSKQEFLGFHQVRAYCATMQLAVCDVCTVCSALTALTPASNSCAWFDNRESHLVQAASQSMLERNITQENAAVCNAVPTPWAHQDSYVVDGGCSSLYHVPPF